MSATIEAYPTTVHKILHAVVANTLTEEDPLWSNRIERKRKSSKI